MATKKDLIIAVLSTFCLTVTLFAVMPIKGAYDPWADINDDGAVDMKDISTVAKLFGVDYPDPRYKPNCDIIYDLAIDMKDISFAAKRFGQEDP